ncbi:MAG TPA: DUF2249 domain-containing protein [Ktedonobacteraceae bacterium]|nr:DUF2249 domain-containing protein [Ktedonobacteraceae bacterium]
MEEQMTTQESGAILLDVRPDLARGDEPFARIMQAAASVKEGQALVIIAPFEPVPLYGVLAAQGFTHETRQAGAAEWVVRFVRS